MLVSLPNAFAFVLGVVITMAFGLYLIIKLGYLRPPVG